MKYTEPKYDPSDFDTIEWIAKVVAPLFAFHGWTYGSEVPSERRLAETIRYLYEHHGKDGPLEYTSSGRFVLTDENPHDGTSVLHDGIRVSLDLGELPPLFGDEVVEA